MTKKRDQLWSLFNKLYRQYPLWANTAQSRICPCDRGQLAFSGSQCSQCITEEMQKLLPEGHEYLASELDRTLGRLTSLWYEIEIVTELTQVKRTENEEA